MANATKDSTSRLFAAVREAQDRDLRLDDPHERARVRARLLQAVDRANTTARTSATSSPRGAGWSWGLGTLAAAACAVAVFFAWPGEGPLEFEIDGVEVAAKQTIVAGEYTRTLSFSDRSRVELSPGSRMYVDELRQDGASVVLEHGEIALNVHHEDDTSWQVAAGPYAVHVTGTQFRVAWEPVAESFSVAVSEGSVRVEGPEGEIASLRAGESLVRERGKATIEPETLEAHPSTKPSEHGGDTESQQIAALTPTAEQAEAPEKIEADTLPSKASKANTGPSWTELFDDADYDAAWETLVDRPGGVHGEAKRVGADTLLDLADLARFTKHRDDARKLLETLRERFPDSDEAGEAAFTLGRLAAERGSQAKAASWFELYLDELPSGSLAGDALGRLMDSYESLGRSAEAESAAQRYLARFPKGPHAAKAANILGG
jgi:transmembrane sensor